MHVQVQGTQGLYPPPRGLLRVPPSLKGVSTEEQNLQRGAAPIERSCTGGGRRRWRRPSLAIPLHTLMSCGHQRIILELPKLCLDGIRCHCLV
ncbi:hypothetical protein QJS10_CPA16g01532 [Acorus calamus]|uniref:Uncharacterized protein n=1 Tax=Acorus calamus TaxID=4465 RepID=A0AAV9D0Y3_ACOCL|nr:hypothetical protein QJS10_CPA16g01532 [Acorus calamus]